MIHHMLIFIGILVVFLFGWWLIHVLVVRYIQRPIDRKQLALFDEKTSPSAQVRSLCMVTENAMESPGVAQVLEGKLFVYSLIGTSVEAPIEQVKIVRVRKNKLRGHSGWWHTTILRVECPGADQPFKIGVKDPEPWMRAFNLDEEKSHV
ncbi:hypothetical protein LLG95_04850 [bacterium]|nr:hypothetical protein [bacterium]